jgi:hypothetical protein
MCKDFLTIQFQASNKQINIVNYKNIKFFQF